jgi:hypoxanthine phosphoribosyltransferase
MPARDRSERRKSAQAAAPGRETLGRELISARRIRAAVAAIGAQVRATYGGEELTIVSVLDGAILFTADLLRELDMPVRVETVSARSYRDAATAPGQLSLGLERLHGLVDRHVLIVDDILDTGRTLERLRREIGARRPRSLRIAVLLEKPCRRAAHVRVDFRGFEIPDRFVVGYGMDHDGRYRNLRGIRVLDAGGAAGPSDGAAPGPGST